VLVSCTKGILNDTLETVDKILERVLPASFHRRLAFLSGPSFAAEARPARRPPAVARAQRPAGAEQCWCRAQVAREKPTRVPLAAATPGCCALAGPCTGVRAGSRARRCVTVAARDAAVCKRVQVRCQAEERCLPPACAACADGRAARASADAAVDRPLPVLPHSRRRRCLVSDSGSPVQPGAVTAKRLGQHAIVCCTGAASHVL